MDKSVTISYHYNGAKRAVFIKRLSLVREEFPIWFSSHYIIIYELPYKWHEQIPNNNLHPSDLSGFIDYESEYG